MISVKCQACGKTVQKFPKDAKRSKYHFCSDKCRSASVVPVTCAHCKNTFYTSGYSYRMAKYCSTECKNASKREQWKTDKGAQVTMTCAQCGKEFRTRCTLKDKQEFCSRKCFHASNRLIKKGESNSKWKPKIRVVCHNCGKEFETYPSRKKRRKYCSRKCRVIGNLARLASGKRTGIEVAMAQALSQAKIRYNEQSVMFNKFMVDFELPDHKIIVQCDGRYWHDRPDAKRRDKGQDRYLAKAGYVVLRFSDAQIKSDIQSCIRQIKHTMLTRQLPLIHY